MGGCAGTAEGQGRLRRDSARDSADQAWGAAVSVGKDSVPLPSLPLGSSMCLAGWAWERRPLCSPPVWAGTAKLCTCYPTDTGFSGDQPPGQSTRTPSGPHR